MATGITESTVEEIKARLDLVDLISSYGIQVRTAGSSKKACCPFHHEKTPSFNINESKGFYHCFGCGESGDAIKFVQKMEGLTFVEAVKKLAERCGVRIEEKEDPTAGRRKRLLALMAELAQFYHRCLEKTKEAEPAREYLKSRDLGPDVQEGFLIGYAPNGIATILKWGEKYGYTPEELSEAGVIKPPRDAQDRGYHRFGGRLMFSIRDKQGRVVAFSGRQLVASKNSGKYVNSPETPIFKKSNVLFGFDKAAGNIAKSPRHEAIVCEGQIDTIRLHVSGFPVAVASQGTAFTEEHVRMLKKVADSVVLVFDDDAAGHKATIRTAGLFLAAEMPVRVVSLPGGDDPDSYLRAHPKEDFQQLLDNAESIMSFQVRAEKAKERNPESIDAVARITKAILATIAQSANAVLKASMVGEAAKLLGLPSAALQEELGKVRIEPIRPVARPAEASDPEAAFDGAEEAFEGVEDVPSEEEPALEGESAAAVAPPPAKELALCEFLMANEYDKTLDGLVGEFLPRSVFAHDFTWRFVETWRAECVEEQDLFGVFAEGLSGRERAWFDAILLNGGLSQASAMSAEEILRDFIRALWCDCLSRERGELPAAGDPEADIRRMQLSMDLKRLQSARWQTVATMVRDRTARPDRPSRSDGDCSVRESSFMRSLLCVAAVVVQAIAAWADGASVESRLSRVYFENEAPTFAVSGADGTFRWQLADWRGTTVREGVGTNGTSVALSPLPPGFWSFGLSGGPSLTFSVLVDPAKRRPVKSSPYGIDSALSWLAAPQHFYRTVAANPYHYVADLLKAAGVVETRERMSAAEVGGKDGFAGNWGRYLDNARYLKSLGIGVSGMFEDLPPWTRQKGTGRFDLVRVRDFCRTCAETFGDAMVSWEFMNEEENKRAPWVYAALAKAASVGFHAANPEIVFANMGICFSVDSAWHRTLAENGLLPYLGVYNYHTYADFRNYDKGHASVRAYLERNGFADLPVYVSENGTYVEGPARAKTDRERFKAHSPEQELAVADFIPKSFVLRQFAGIWRTQYFTFPPYNEQGGGKDWGVLRRDGSAKPGIAALSTLTAELQGLDCLGRLDLGDGVSAYLYQDGRADRQVIAFWSEDGTKRIAVRSACPARLVNWCGTPEELPAGDLSLTADRRIGYLHGSFGLTVAQKPHPVGKPRPYAFPSDREPNVILLVHFDENDFSETDSRSAVEAKIGGRWRATVEVWNLSDRTKKGRLAATDAVKVVGLPDEIEVPANAVVSVPVSVRSECGADGWAWLRLHGEFDGRRTFPFAVRMLDAARLLANCRCVDGKCASPSEWEKNTSADRRTVEADGEGGVKLSYYWEKPFADKWFYPRLSVPAEAQKTLEYVEYEIRSSQEKVENAYLTANLFCVLPDGRHLRVHDVVPPAKVWERRLAHVVRPSDGSPIVKVEIGGNPDGRQVDCHIRNVRFYYRP